jgi:hypothetical protein
MNNLIIKNGNDFKVIPEDSEICVCCGKDANVSKFTHVDLRDNYVDGAGQLCEECFVRIYKN